MMASFVSGWPTTAEDPKTRRVVQRPSSKPPPSATDEMAVMVGIGRVERSVKVFLRPVRNSLVLYYDE